VYIQLVCISNQSGKAGPCVLLNIIENQINLLPPQCKEVFTRSAILGEKHSEIATHLGLSIKTVENHLTRARKILKEKLKKIL
jgi:RNA polymerase sigma-70 factor (ECF subfamily)